MQSKYKLSAKKKLLLITAFLAVVIIAATYLFVGAFVLERMPKSEPVPISSNTNVNTLDQVSDTARKTLDTSSVRSASTDNDQSTTDAKQTEDEVIAEVFQNDKLAEKSQGKGLTNRLQRFFSSIF
jgi:hypothetical protein